MRHSEFVRAVTDEFGTAGDTMLQDLVLATLGSRTPAQALAAGVAPREVWLALCDEADVPPDRRYGVGLLQPRGR